MKTKILKMFNWPRFFALAFLVCLIWFSVSNPLGAQSVTEGFGSDEQLQRGMIITVDKNDNSKIKAATKDTANDIHGIIVNANDTPVTLSQEGQQYFVATAGRYDVLLSNQNGNIKKGDYIAISSVPGIGMKASEEDPIIVGRALADFDDKKDVVSTTKLKDNKGKEFEVSISHLPVQIGVSKNPLLKSADAELPSALKRITDTVAGKETSAIRAYIALAIFVLSAMAAGTLMYGGVRSAITSVGRNPLSKTSIMRSMVKVVVTGLIVFISGLFGVYLILRL